MPSTQDVATNHEYRSLPIATLVESPTNPRMRFDKGLWENWRPVSRRRASWNRCWCVPLKERKYEVVIGARRLKAARLPELESVPGRVIKLTDAEAIEAQVVENLQREDTHPLEESLGFKSLLQLGEPTYTMASIAARAGKSEAYVQGRSNWRT